MSKNPISDNIRSQQDKKDSKEQRNEEKALKRHKNADNSTSRVSIINNQDYHQLKLTRIYLKDYISQLHWGHFIVLPFLLLYLGVFSILLFGSGIPYSIGVPIVIFGTIFVVRILLFILFPAITFQITSDGYFAYNNNKFLRKTLSMGDKAENVQVILLKYSQYSPRRGAWDTRYGWNRISVETKTEIVTHLSDLYHINDQDVIKIKGFLRKNKVSVKSQE